MKISYNWLKDYCRHDMSPQELADGLSRAGLCVETYEPGDDGDWMLDVEVTSNRPDCLSHLGIAREVAAMTGTRISEPMTDISKLSGQEGSSPPPKVDVRCPDLCPHYSARILRNVTIKPSPPWMQQRLMTCGLRPVNNIVDITNYVLLESGQPMHAFDLNRLSGRHIVVRRAENNERIVTIDGTECTLNADICVIADETKPVAVAGVMGGRESEINEKTTDVLLESARFHPVNIRRTSRSIAISSDSSYRFERGIDPENVVPASLRCTELIAELADGEIDGALSDIRADASHSPEVTMRIERLVKILGMNVPADTAAAIFEGLGLSILHRNSESITVAVPPRRPDLAREIDLIEEVARIYGYDRIPEKTGLPIVMAPLSKKQICRRKIKNLLAGQGFTEIITPSLISPEPLQVAQPWHSGDPIQLRNPVSSDKTHLRLTNMGNLFAAKQLNSAHNVPHVDLFETGTIYLPSDRDMREQPEEKNCLTLLTDRDNGFFVLKGLLQNICSVLYIPRHIIEERQGEMAAFSKETSLLLYLGDDMLGCLGRVAADMADGMDADDLPAMMELDLDLLLRSASVEPTLRALPRYPAVKRDIAIVVDENTRWADIEKCVLRDAPDELESLDFLDIYRGKQIEKGKKSIAFSIALRSPERTLTNEEADHFRDSIVAALAAEHGAMLRT